MSPGTLKEFGKRSTESMKRLNIAAGTFVKTANEFKEYDGDKIVSHFLSAFRQSDEVTQENARETEQIIKQFESTVTKLMETVAAVRMAMQPIPNDLALLELRTSVDRLKTQTAARQHSMNELENAFEKACQAWNQAESILIVADFFIDRRSETLRIFRDKHIPYTSEDLNYFRKQHDWERVKDIIYSEASKRFTDTGKAALKIFLGELPPFKIAKIGDELSEAARGKKVDTSLGGTGIMNQLLSQLRKENRALETISEAFKELEEQCRNFRASIKNN